MQKQNFISVSMDDQPEIQCLPMREDEPGLGLSEGGITWCEPSDALLYIDAHSELMIKCVTSQHIEIERNHRKYILTVDQPVRIIPKDIIRIGDSSAHQFNILHIYRSSKPLALSKRLSKIAMFAFATSIVMACSVACNRPEPNNPTDVIQINKSSDPQTSNTSEDALEESDIQLSIPYQTTGVVAIPIEEASQLLKPEDDFVDQMKSDLESDKSELTQ